MTTQYYCTPEWLEKSKELYSKNPEAREKLKKLTADMGYHIKADPAWGIDKDIYFCACFDAGDMYKLEIITKQTANEIQYLMVAPPKAWKSVLTKKTKFLSDFMLGKIKLEKGSKVGVLSIAPHATNVLDALVPPEMNLVFSDDLNPDDLEEYRDKMVAFRKELGV